MRIRNIKKSVAVSAVILPLIASSALAADIQIWSNEKELENGNHLILDADDTGGDVFLQFGNTLGESLSWDSANARFNLSNSLNVEGNISLTGNVEMEDGKTVDGVDVSELGADVTALENRVSTNETNISSNDDDISDLQSEQTTQNTNIQTNADNISSNDTDISNLQDEQTTQNNDIDALEEKVGDANFDGTNYIFGKNLTESLIILDDKIKTNTDDIATNKTNIDTNADNISSNDNDISDLQNEQTTQNNRISTNEDDIDALESALSSPKAESLLVPFGGVTIKEDGSNNVVNVFRSADDSGFGHNFHTVTTSQSTQQDINLDFEIKTPADVKDLTSITLSYKTDGAAEDSKIDISVVDASGNTIATSSDLSSGSWADVTLDISGHSATAGEILTVEVTGYTKSENASYVGEIVFDYTEEK